MKNSTKVIKFLHKFDFSTVYFISNWTSCLQIFYNCDHLANQYTWLPVDMAY